MRSDMHKVIVDHPRFGGHMVSGVRARSKYRAHVDPDEAEYAPTQRKKRYSDYKVFGDRTAPLYRYLEAQCGRPWRLVYSEVCAVATSNSTMHAHLRDHVRGYVHTQENEDFFARFRSFYVDDHGILRKRPPWKYVAREVVIRGVPVTETTGYVCEHGCWYEVEFQYAGLAAVATKDYWRLYSGGNEHMRFQRKRALSSKEIKKLRLRDRLP